MTAWGMKIKELLAQHNKSASWLAQETKIARSTISNWLNNPDGVTPKPDKVARVARAFGLKARDLAPYAGYTIAPSESADEREARLRSLMLNKRWSDALDEAARTLSVRDQDTVISMIESFTASRRRNSSKSQ